MKIGGKKSQNGQKKGPKRDLKQKDISKFICPHEMEFEGRQQKAILNCKDCDGPHNLGEKKCNAGTLNVFNTEFGVQSFTLTHYVEKQQFGQTMELYNYMKIFSNTLENLALRDPQKEYLGMIAPSQKKKINCNACKFNPGTLFTDLRSAFVKDIADFYHDFSTAVREIEKTKLKRKPCDKCIASTIEDMEYVYDIYENLAEYILSKGFSVMLKRGARKK